ncbi:MAG TPA: hypothetical protein VGD37_14760 [Kofleriaceae bacterium]|jgi:hypothetical protein
MLARKVNRGRARGIAASTGNRNMSHLENIATRQRKSLVRDALFATFVALAAIVSITTVTQAVVASSATLHR